MTDKEIRVLCAQAMGAILVSDDIHDKLKELTLSEPYMFDPLTNDEQAMGLVKKMELWIQPPRQGHLSSPPSEMWFVAHSAKGGDSKSHDLNRAICECVANMEKRR